VIGIDFKVCHVAGVPLIAYKNKSLKAPIHVENLGEIKMVLKPIGGPRI